MTLKEILAERKRAAQTASDDSFTDNQVLPNCDTPNYVFTPPMTEFEAYFADCTDF